MTRSATRGSATWYQANRPERADLDISAVGQAGRVGRDPPLGQANVLHALGYGVLRGQQEFQQPQPGRVAERAEGSGHQLHALGCRGQERPFSLTRGRHGRSPVSRRGRCECLLSYGAPPLVSAGDGTLIGSGDGAVHGRKVNGKLERTVFELPGSTVCPMASVAMITTDDGAEIRLEGRGYATRPSQSDPSWRVAATLYLTTDDSRYSWLHGALALWEGKFNEATHHARYTAFLQLTVPAV